MDQQELMKVAFARFSSGMQVLIPDSGMVRCASVDQIVQGIFNGIPGFGLMVWFPGSLFANAYELSWALEHIQVLSC